MSVEYQRRFLGFPLEDWTKIGPGTAVPACIVDFVTVPHVELKVDKPSVQENEDRMSIEVTRGQNNSSQTFVGHDINKVFKLPNLPFFELATRST